jgi:hypothetical protein
MEKERDMEEHAAIPALQEFPQLSRLPFFRRFPGKILLC